MAKEEIAYKVSVEVEGGAKSLSELKKEFKEAQKSLEGLQQGTEEYIAALGRLGDARDGVADLNEEINALAGLGGSIKAVGNVVSGLAGGFAAAQGAMALFGGENEDLQKTLVKLQTVMAIQQGLAGLEGLGQSFKALTGVLKTTAIGTKLVTAAQWLWNAAMMANPIVLLVTAIAGLIAAFVALSSASDDAAEKQARLNELEKEAAERVEAHIEQKKKLQKILQATGDFELDLAKTLGKSSSELYEIEKKNIEKKLNNLQYLVGYRGKLNAEELLEQNKLKRDLALLDTKYSIETISTAKKERDEKAKIEDEKTKKWIEENKKKELDERAFYQRLFDEQEKINARKRSEAERIKKENEDRILAEEQVAATIINNNLERLKLEEEANAAKDERERQAYVDKMNLRIQLESDAINSIQNLSDIAFAIRMKNVKKGSAEEEKVARQSFKINKALQLSTAVINGIQATQSILAQYPKFDGGIAMVAALVSVGTASIANIAKIASTQFGSASGGGGGGAISIDAPRISPPTQGSTQLNADGSIKQNNNASPVVKAIVVETDITKTQKRVNTLEVNSKI